MSELGKAFKVIRFIHTSADGDVYLTACDDQFTVICQKSKDELTATNINWRIQWLPYGECLLWSCYNKVLAVHANPFRSGDLIVFQSNWPLEDGSSATWYPRFKRNYLAFEVKLDILHDYRVFFCDSAPFSGGIPEILRDVWYKRAFTLEYWRVHVMETVTESDCNEVCGNYREGNYLPHWKVGQVVFNGGGYGSGGSSHYNSGHNTNVSGKQTNGDVNVQNDFGNYTKFHLQF